MIRGEGACLVCGKPIRYFDKMKKMECVFCHKEFESNACCEEGHFVCDECHEKRGVEVILRECETTASRDPIEIMRKLMEDPYIYMHGPEHHIMAGAALLTAYHNCGGQIDLKEALEEMRSRGSKYPGGACGMWGACGAALSAGICFSIMTSSSPLSVETWGLGNRLTAACLSAIGETGGPRCCKRDSFTALHEAVKFIGKNLGIVLEEPEQLLCRFSDRNSQCIRFRCPYYPGRRNGSKNTLTGIQNTNEVSK